MQNLKFYKKDPLFSGEDCLYELKLNDQGNISEVIFQTKKEGPLLAFLDALVQLSLGKNQKTLLSLTLREVESFLRDQNHMPAFPLEEEGNIKEAFLFKEKLRQAVYQVWQSKEAIPSLEQGSFAHMPLINQARFLQQVVEQKILPPLRRDQGGVQLVQILYPKVSLRFQGECLNCEAHNQGTLHWIQAQLRSHAKAEEIICEISP
ncbi:MAG: NifU family protein [Bacteriovoracaceae bacterium]|nr:NifU family protein [Bacteriovoracaceae bacterium]